MSRGSVQEVGKGHQYTVSTELGQPMRSLYSQQLNQFIIS